jgi:hypothetical protein
MDWPETQTPLFIGTAEGLYGVADTMRAYGGPGVTTSTWPAANLAIYVPFTIPFRYPVKRVWWVNGSTITGNIAYGIYSHDMAKIYATASTAQSGASVMQYTTPSPDFVLPPGDYYHALIVSATTAALVSGLSGISVVEGRICGLVEQAVGSMTLPDLATPAQFGQTIWPLCGITRTTTGF